MSTRAVGVSGREQIAVNDLDGVLVRVRGVSKSFPGVRALDDVDWDVREGEVHALVGENGAGKSTLVKSVCGVYQVDAGQLWFGGEEYTPAGPLDAIKVGIRVVHQEFNLLSELSIEENLAIEHMPRRLGMFVDRKAMRSKAAELLAQVGLAVPLGTKVAQLGVAQMQLLEIARALSTRSRLLVLDEPTASLTSKEIDALFGIVRTLKARGVTMIYISHHLDELYEIADRVTVMRNGRVAATHNIADVTVPELVRTMVGRSLDDMPEPPTSVDTSRELLRVTDLRPARESPPISFALYEGEILGIAGLVGSGRTEAMRALFGADARAGGSVHVRGEQVQIASPADAVRHGICLLTEDRKDQGLMLDLPCATNISITDLSSVSRKGMLNRRRESALAEDFRRKLDIRTPTVATPARNLSGGNQQKVVLAKWLLRDAAILIVDEPTRGIDVGAKFEIYTLLRQVAAEGKGVIVVSSDLNEITAICHRLLVFSKGEIAGQLMRAEFDHERILELAYSRYVTRAASGSRA